ncbi:MAG: surface carbohydrate biosynthesis protein [Rhizobiaceae bacterium]
MQTKDDAPVLVMPVEIQARELMSRILIAALAAERGYRVILGQDVLVRRLAPFLPRGIMLDKSLGLPRHGKPQRFARLGYKIAIQDEEGTGFYGSPDRFLDTRLADETLAVTKRWFCISDQMRSAAAARYPAHAGKFVTTGLARTDIWRPTFRGLYEAEMQAIRREHGPFILFCSNFSYLIHGRGEAFVQRQLKAQRSQITNAEDPIERIRAQGARNLEKFLEILPQVADWFPAHKLIIRPHPGEAVGWWQERFGANPRIEVISSGTATNWILASDCLFHHGCTTGVEAAIMGKKNVMYAPVPDEHHDTELMRAFAPVVKTPQDLRAAMQTLVGGGDIEPELADRKEEWYRGLEGKLVASTLLDELDALRFPGKPVSRLIGTLRYLPSMLVARFKPRSARARAYSLQKWQGLPKSELENRLRQSAQIAGASTAINVRELIPDLFEISAG